jgi:hypothetical protein
MIVSAEAATYPTQLFLWAKSVLKREKALFGGTITSKNIGKDLRADTHSAATARLEGLRLIGAANRRKRRANRMVKRMSVPFAATPSAGESSSGRLSTLSGLKPIDDAAWAECLLPRNMVPVAA